MTGRRPTSWTVPLRRVSAAYVLLAAPLVTNALFETPPAIERTLLAANPHLSGGALRDAVAVGFVLRASGAYGVIIRPLPRRGGGACCDAAPGPV